MSKAFTSEEPGLKVVGVHGDVLVSFSSMPFAVSDVELEIEDRLGIPAALQKLLLGNDLLESTSTLEPSESELLVTLIVDDSPLSTWDLDGNPDKEQLSCSGGDMILKGSGQDYVLVLTQAPLTSGTHFFEFIMHKVQDEQWCGVVTDKSRAGHSCGESIYGRNPDFKAGWFYYCGRRYHAGGRQDFDARDDSELSDDPDMEEEDQEALSGDGHAALHWGGERRAAQKFKSVGDDDVIGLLVNVDEGILVFTCNGQVQGACEVPKKGPLYVSTCPDRTGDHVELRKVALADVPQATLDAQRGPVYQGKAEETALNLFCNSLLSQLQTCQEQPSFAVGAVQSTLDWLWARGAQAKPKDFEAKRVQLEETLSGLDPPVKLSLDNPDSSLNSRGSRQPKKTSEGAWVPHVD